MTSTLSSLSNWCLARVRVRVRVRVRLGVRLGARLGVGVGVRGALAHLPLAP